MPQQRADPPIAVTLAHIGTGTPETVRKIHTIELKLPPISANPAAAESLWRKLGAATPWTLSTISGRRKESPREEFAGISIIVFALQLKEVSVMVKHTLL